MDYETIMEEFEGRLMDALEALERDLAGFRTGKASTGLVEGLMVDYYGAATRLRDIAGISTPEPRLIVIQPWDQNALGAIEKAILASDIGISPVNDGRVIRLPVPELSEERRKQLAKEAKKRCEDGRIEVRTHRRWANDEAKKGLRDKELTEDSQHELVDEIQKLTDEYIGKVEAATAAKEEELMQV